MRKPEVEILTCVETTAKHTVKINRELLLSLVRDVMPRSATDVRVYFQVPGGGDWSNMAVDIDDEHPVYVQWTTRDVQDKRETR